MLGFIPTNSTRGCSIKMSRSGRKTLDFSREDEVSVGRLMGSDLNLLMLKKWSRYSENFTRLPVTSPKRVKGKNFKRENTSAAIIKLQERRIKLRVACSIISVLN